MRDLFLLRPGTIYLNNGSFGACPLPVFEAWQHFQFDLESHPGAFLGRCYSKLLPEGRERLGAYLGADASELVFVVNATMGVNIVGRSVALEPGDEVLTTDQEYSNLDQAWEFLCSKRGAKYIHQKVQLPVESADDVVEAVWSGVTDRTKVLYLSHITSTTALILPIKQLIQRARERGIITLIDGAHAPGQIDLDMHDLGCDFYTGNCHKWMLTPKGSAFLYARREMHHLVEPLVVSGGWRGWENRNTFIEEQQYQGTRDVSPFLAVPVAIDFMEDHDWLSVRQRCRELIRYARQEIGAMVGVPPVCPDSPEWFSQINTIPLPKGDYQALGRLLRERHIEIPVTGHDGNRFLRLSVQGYNSKADIDALIGTVRDWMAEAATGEEQAAC
ncbi:MAG: aminotransferase class V-fold PLP-dependent enzyme [Chloroflexi bacterium]|nr:aminotransferase class V-fold PLP-dependent enzyme [Chloroflexota bacterium]